MTPLQAEEEVNESEVRKHLLLYFWKRGGVRKKPKYHVNETVRIWKKRGTFHRGYDENFTREFFKIIKVMSNLPVPRYQLADSKGDTIIGSFFEDELVRYTPPEVFEIDVISERGRGRKKEYLVHYLGYPKSMDEWVDRDKLINL